MAEGSTPPKDESVERLAEALARIQGVPLSEARRRVLAGKRKTVRPTHGTGH